MTCAMKLVNFTLGAPFEKGRWPPSAAFFKRSSQRGCAGPALYGSYAHDSVIIPSLNTCKSCPAQGITGLHSFCQDNDSIVHCHLSIFWQLVVVVLCVGILWICSIWRPLKNVRSRAWSLCLLRRRWKNWKSNLDISKSSRLSWTKSVKRSVAFLPWVEFVYSNNNVATLVPFHEFLSSFVEPMWDGGRYSCNEGGCLFQLVYT